MLGSSQLARYPSILYPKIPRSALRISLETDNTSRPSLHDHDFRRKSAGPSDANGQVPGAASEGNPMNEADTCTRLIRPKLEAVGWDNAPHLYNEQVSFTDGRIVVAGSKVRRRKRKIAEFLLRFTRDLTLAVVEAKSDEEPAGAGMQQAKEYAEILGLKFAYASNGNEMLEFDYFTGQERSVADYPGPDELWQRYKAGMNFPGPVTQGLLAPSYPCEKGRRYYHQLAINRILESIFRGKKRTLLTMATGTGKTITAFHIC